jgi:peptidoglycan/LPS O-acetylase OafA/YrhL
MPQEVYATRAPRPPAGGDAASPERARVFSLDVLRGVAILLVLVRHTPGWPTSGAAGFFYEVGWTGVDLFFVLSGYLISGLLYGELDRTGGIKVGRFWLRRGFKIWPSYFACYGGWVLCKAAADILTGAGPKAGARLKAALPNLIFIQNYVGLEGAWPHSWSLAIEEHFYLALPVLFVAACALRRGRPLLAGLPFAAASVCVAVLCLRLWAYAGGARDWQSFYYPTHMRADALAFGVLLGYLQKYHREKFRAAGRRWPYLLAFSAPMIATAAVFPLEASPVSYLFGFTLLYLAYGGLVVAAGTYTDFGSRRKITRAVARLGVYSYTIYLAHSVVHRLPFISTGMGRLLREHAWVDMVAFWVLSVAGGVALSHCVERPFLRLRAKLYPPRDGAAPAHINAQAEPLVVVGPTSQAV